LTAPPFVVGELAIALEHAREQAEGAVVIGRDQLTVSIMLETAACIVIDFWRPEQLADARLDAALGAAQVLSHHVRSLPEAAIRLCEGNAGFAE
jgi:hypothetical protein